MDMTHPTAVADARPRGGLSPANLARVLEYIDASIAGPLPLRALAQSIPMSTFHFARAFRISTGMTPHRFVMARRLAKAREILALDLRPLSEVAHATGFRTASHFNHVFRRHMGETPGHYRAILRATRAGLANPPRDVGVPAVEMKWGQAAKQPDPIELVGVRGFEPPASTSRT